MAKSVECILCQQSIDEKAITPTKDVICAHCVLILIRNPRKTHEGKREDIEDTIRRFAIYKDVLSGDQYVPGVTVRRSKHYIK